MSLIFSKAQKIKFSHCDAAGIVFYPRFFEMLNELVEDWFEEALDLSFKKLHTYGGVPTATIQTDFIAPAKLGDTLIKTLTVLSVSEKSLTYQFQFKKEDQIILKGSAVLVYIKKNSDGSLNAIAWETLLKEKIKSYEIER